MRKHHTQMSSKELEFLNQYVGKVSNWSFTLYSFKRVRGRMVTKVDALRVLTEGSIVEYHQVDGKHRILYRGHFLVGRNCEVCAVFEPDTQNVITTYRNYSHDCHATLDWSQYDSKIDIIREIKGDFLHV
ncbi:hypothetical protein SECTIM467_113 [Brevibacillus phage SecTim467]|uniref:Uncharacterized protein n=2 Tax=Jenstvirus jenst TaxID=1982225 RepID=A0A0K2CP85_9CAUD|nr:hypothetical protein AVV11_gp083 [Brevibacillus phage Jenst]ALA07237.1 hypothetical protein JENST_108 [Brevibacillus phage Jenst]ALA07581.1 hypothetical protein SECTIM467_113 [Brevibacillus phage SecTim467]